MNQVFYYILWVLMAYNPQSIISYHSFFSNFPYRFNPNFSNIFLYVTGTSIVVSKILVFNSTLLIAVCGYSDNLLSLGCVGPKLSKLFSEEFS